MKVRGQDLKHPWVYGIAALFFLFSLVDAAGDHPLGGSVRAAQVVIATMILYERWQQPTISPWARRWVRFGLAALMSASVGIFIILRTVLHWSSRSTGGNTFALGRVCSSSRSRRCSCSQARAWSTGAVSRRGRSRMRPTESSRRDGTERGSVGNHRWRYPWLPVAFAFVAVGGIWLTVLRDTDHGITYTILGLVGIGQAWIRGHPDRSRLAPGLDPSSSARRPTYANGAGARIDKVQVGRRWNGIRKRATAPPMIMATATTGSMTRLKSSDRFGLPQPHKGSTLAIR
jgi:hypothetical protein